MKDTQEKAMEELFDFAHPEQCRELLWEWLRVTVTGGFKRLTSKEKSAILMLYERVDKVIESGS
jgi:hypothetical protein